MFIALLLLVIVIKTYSGHPVYNGHQAIPQGWPLYTGLTVCTRDETACFSGSSAWIVSYQLTVYLTDKLPIGCSTKFFARPREISRLFDWFSVIFWTACDIIRQSSDVLLGKSRNTLNCHGFLSRVIFGWSSTTPVLWQGVSYTVQEKAIEENYSQFNTIIMKTIWNLLLVWYHMGLVIFIMYKRARRVNYCQRACRA